MGIVILLVVALVMTETLWDWREHQRASAWPKWLGGLAVCGITVAALGALASFGSAFYRHSLAEVQGAVGGSLFVPETGFLLCCLGVIIAALKKKSARTLLLVAGVLAFAVWLGFALYS